MNKPATLREQILLQKPTDQQKDAIFADEFEYLLRAAPGSGKTWTSCRRFIWRGANWHYSAGGLALLSFTNTAIREFQEATIRVGRRELLTDPNYVGTFDSFVERFILTPFGHLIAGSAKRPKLFIAPRPGDRNNKKLLAWIKFKGGNKATVPAWEIIPYPDNNKVAFKTNNGSKLDQTGCDAVKELLKLGFYTHAQRVYWACQLLFNRPHLAKVLAKRFPEIIVDEAQDTNIWLIYLLNFLRKYGSKITLVGDPDQCIYEFSMADATSLPALKDKWKMPEKPLSQSFRCNNRIASTARNIGGNPDFSGNGDGQSIHHRPVIIREPTERFTHSVTEFQRVIKLAGMPESSSTIICRAHQQLESIRGEANYSKLKGVTKELAQASFFRDCRKDYKRAFKIVESAIRELAGDDEFWNKVNEFPMSEEALRVQLAIWRFVKYQTGLPAVTLSSDEWIAQTRKNLTKLIIELKLEVPKNLNMKIKKTGLDDKQIKLPLFEAQTLFPQIRQETIHKVKGESIDAVLVLGSTKFWNSVVNAVASNTSSEDRRLAYVAMTRARHLLAIGLPASHFDKHVDIWKGWGFDVLHN